MMNYLENCIWCISVGICIFIFVTFTFVVHHRKYVKKKQINREREYTEIEYA